MGGHHKVFKAFGAIHNNMGNEKHLKIVNVAIVCTETRMM